MGTTFSPKDWRDATTHEGGGDTSTPISAAALEDAETRVTSSGGRTITAGAATQIPLALRAAVSQSGNMFQSEDSDGTPRASLGAPSVHPNLYPGLLLWGDPSDASPNLAVGNITAGAVHDGAYYRADVQFYIDGDRRWDPILIDVGDSAGTGTGSRNGGSNEGFGDLVIGYRRDPVEAGQSQDVIYIVDERNSRMGFHENVEAADDAQFQFGIRKAGVNGIYLNEARTLEDLWMLRFLANDTAVGGFYKPASGALDGELTLALGADSVPTEVLQVWGKAKAFGFIPDAGAAFGAYVQVETPLIYASNNASGNFPWNADGHLLIQPRGVAGSSSRDIVLAASTGEAGGAGATTPRLVIRGADKGLTINPSPTAPDDLIAGATGALGWAYGSYPPSSSPTGGVLIWPESGDLYVMTPDGSAEAIGQVGPSSLPGFATAAAGSHANLDTALYRKAAKLWMSDSSIGTLRTTAPADGDLSAGEVAIYFDSTNGAAKLMIKGKSANGTVVTGNVALA